MSDPNATQPLYDGTAAPDETDAMLDKFTGHFTYYRSIRRDLNRITGLVQENPEFFHAHLGESCIRVAAETLERLVADWKEIRR